MSKSYDAAALLLQRLPELPDGVLHGDWIDIDTIIGDRPWSDGEWALITAAQDLYNGAGCCTLGQLLASTDDVYFAAVVHALQLRRPEAFRSNLALDTPWLSDSVVHKLVGKQS